MVGCSKVELQLAMAHLRIVEHIIQLVDRSSRYTRLFQRRQDAVAHLVQEGSFKCGDQYLAMTHAAGVIGVAQITGQIG